MTYRPAAPTSNVVPMIEELRKLSDTSEKILDAINSAKSFMGGTGSMLGAAAGAAGSTSAGAAAGAAAGITTSSGISSTRIARGVSETIEKELNDIKLNKGGGAIRFGPFPGHPPGSGNVPILQPGQKPGQPAPTTPPTPDEPKKKAEDNDLVKAMKEVAKETKESTKEKKKKTKKDKEDGMFDDMLALAKKGAPPLAAAYATVGFMAPGSSRVGDPQSVHFAAMQDSMNQQTNPLHWLYNAGVNAWNIGRDTISGIAKGVR